MELRKQYQIDDNELKELLLSPRATSEGRGYTCCTTCSKNIRDNKFNKPPRFGLTNGFVIGYVPNDVVDEIDDVLAASIARLRIFSYVFSFVPDAHKSIKGHHTLFMNEPEQIERALQHMSNKIGRPNVYTMISGNLTPKQREIARKRCKIDTRKFSSLLD